MGSKEYPAESEYERYISTHAGIMNAWTSGDHTLYYFNVLPLGLLGALDRLSQFFVAPVFSLFIPCSSSYFPLHLSQGNEKQSIQNTTWAPCKIVAVSGS